MPEITVRGAGVHYQDTIRRVDRTILFLHGAGGSHHTWRDQWAGLKGAARLVIPDLPGHGLSGGGAMESIGEYSAWVGDFVRETGLERFVLAGHSMGGAIALQSTIDGLVGIEALILACTGAKLGVSPAILDGVARRFGEFAPELVGRMMAGGSDPLLRDDITRDVLSTRPGVFLADFAACDGFDVRDRLGGIRVPALVIAGDHDRMTPLKHAEFLSANLRGGVLKIIPGAGHLAMLERPVEVNGAVASFLQSLG